MARSRAYRRLKYKRRLKKYNQKKKAARRILMNKPFRPATLRRLGVFNVEPLKDVPRRYLIERFGLSIRH